jgi:glycosyltransferase involved in cell wall biosynthesis
VHIHSPAAGGQLVPALAARLAGCQVFATYHQVQPRALARKTRWLNRVTHNLLVNQTLAVSADVRQTLANNAGLDPRRIEVVPNGIELNTQTRGSTGLPPRESGEVRVGAFGRLSPEKGLVVLLKAVARLSPDAPRVRLFVAGEGPQRQELDALTRDLHLSDRVTFLGFRDDARALMSEMDIVVHVPEYEGFGLVMAEAMAASRPLVVNDAPGGMTDLVNDGVNGIVVRAGAVDELAAAIERLAGDPARREELGANGLVICRQRYSAESVARTVGAFYQSALT